MVDRTQALFAIFVLSCAQGNQAGAMNQATGVCDQVSASASHDSKVPLEILMALARTETGRRQNGELVPWPWALNVEGRGYWFTTKNEALAFAKNQIQNGIESIDFGCFQLNLRWHGAHFASVSSLLDPKTNAYYAARFLRDLYDEHGTWGEAVAAYHSRSPHVGTAYLERFRPIFAELTEEPAPSFFWMPRTAGALPFDVLPAQTNTKNTGSLFPQAGVPNTAFIRH